MKKQVRNFLIGAGLTAVLWAPFLRAQDYESATIPFEFHVGNTTLPAGEYNVIPASSMRMLQLVNRSTGKSVLALPAERRDGSPDPKLAFHRAGTHYFLSTVWMPDGSSYVLHKSPLEKGFEHELGRGMASVTYVALLHHR